LQRYAATSSKALPSKLMNSLLLRRTCGQLPRLRPTCINSAMTAR
jgi:hypothetical protein